MVGQQSQVWEISMGWRGREVDSGQLAITGMGNVDGVEVAVWTVVGWQSQVWEMLVGWR